MTKILHVAFYVFVAVFVIALGWAAFDIHSRVHIAMMFQFPVLLLRVFIKKNGLQGPPTNEKSCEMAIDDRRKDP